MNFSVDFLNCYALRTGFTLSPLNPIVNPLFSLEPQGFAGPRVQRVHTLGIAVSPSMESRRIIETINYRIFAFPDFP